MLSASMMSRLAHRSVTVIGDAILDTFVIGECRKLCREAPVPVITKHEERDFPGGSANTAANLAALGARVRLVAAVGDDPAGNRLMHAIETAGVDTSFVVRAKQPTMHKTRILAGDEYVTRLDAGAEASCDDHLRALIAREVRAALIGCEVVVVSDYALGSIHEITTEPLRSFAARTGRPVVMDARELERCVRVPASIVTPNLEEACAATGNQVHKLAAPHEFEELARMVRSVVRKDAVAVTLGCVGAALAFGGGSSFIPAPPVGVRHTVGAGDSFVAAVALALAGGCDYEDAASLGVLAGSVSVTKPYTAVVTLSELATALKSVPSQPSARVCR